MTPKRATNRLVAGPPTGDLAVGGHHRRTAERQLLCRDPADLAGQPGPAS